MYRRFNEYARKAMQFAEQEAREQRHEYIGTEHVLLGILKTEGTGSQAISNFDINIGELIEKMRDIYSNSEFDIRKELSGMTPRAERTLELAEEYSKRLNQDFVDTGHILYASLADKGGFVTGLLTHVLIDKGSDTDDMKKELTSLLTTGKSSRPSVILDQYGNNFQHS